MNLTRCDRCKTTVESYRAPNGWQTVPRYVKKKGKSVFVGMAHCCTACLDQGFRLDVNGSVKKGV